ncbi:MAG: EAL domain-containing protein [Rhodocyclaceae bacterium]|nr:EAL domain-containing protein [Rhodocyclaceae bacterium]
MKSGFVMDSANIQPGTDVQCLGSFVGPAKVTLRQWTHTGLEESIQDYHRESGLLDGGLIILCLFIPGERLVSREPIYVLFAPGCSLNLRMAALSMGWDTQWLSYPVPIEWLSPMRQITMTAYYVLTIALFSRLFRNELNRIGGSTLLVIVQWTCLPLLLLSLVASYQSFLPILWGATAFGIGIISFMLFRLVFVARSSTVFWYGGSIAVTLFASGYEVAAAALGLAKHIGTINSVTAAMASALMAALAIAEHVHHERLERIKAQSELRHTYEAAPVGLFTLDEKGNFHRCNPALRDMLGIKEACSEIRHWTDYFDDATWEHFQRVAAEEGELDLSGRSDGTAANKIFHIKAAFAGGRIEGSLQDITERTLAHQRLRYLAEYDPLTNALNRRGIEKTLNEAVQGLVNGRALAIAYIDLDRFKLINDLYGHTTGDEVLRSISQRIDSHLGTHQKLGRVGGDEFVIVFPGTTIRQATDVCRGVIASIEDEPCQIEDKAFQVKCSIGLVDVASESIAQDAISIADRACRAAKGSTDSLVVYERDAAAFKERADELNMVSRFGVSRVPDGLFLEMQPIMSLARPYDSHNFEVLLRLREPDGTTTPAGRIIGAAESNGRIALIDRWVLGTLLQWLAEHRARLAKTRFICLNLSGASLNDERFIQDAFSMLAEAGNIVDLLCFEITESVALNDLGNTNRFIDKVRGLGAKVALDDFGAGYTSFSYLRELSADAVKIDGAFVRDVVAHPANLAIVEAIAELSRNLGMKTIAEWAEDVATVEALTEVGVDYVQGFAVARPLAPERILAAQSSAELIEDPQVARFVTESILHASDLVSWQPTAGSRHWHRPH